MVIPCYDDEFITQNNSIVSDISARLIQYCVLLSTVKKNKKTVCILFVFSVVLQYS